MQWLKEVVSFLEDKIGVTPSVAAPGDTNPSDATGHNGLKATGVENRGQISHIS